MAKSQPTLPPGLHKELTTELCPAQQTLDVVATTHQVDNSGRSWFLVQVRLPADELPVRVQQFLATEFKFWQIREAGGPTWEEPMVHGERSVLKTSKGELQMHQVATDQDVVVLEEELTKTTTTTSGTRSDTSRVLHVFFVGPKAISTISSWMRPLGFAHLQADALFDNDGGVEFRSRGGDITELGLPSGRRSAIDPGVGIRSSSGTKPPELVPPNG